METAALAPQTGAVEEPRHLCTVAEPAAAPAEQKCHHFSLRGYVALLQKKDPKLCSLQIFSNNQRQYDENHRSPPPLSAPKHRRWNCSKCVEEVKIPVHRTTSETISMQQGGTNDGCSISIIRTFRRSADSRRLFPCKQESSRGNDADRPTLQKSAQECNPKVSSPSGNKVVTAVNVPATLAEDNVPGTFVERNFPVTKDLQESPNNLDVSASTLNGVSKDVRDLPDDSQMIPSIETDDRKSPCSPKPCVVPNEDDNRTAQDAPNDGPDESNVLKPMSGYKGSKQISGHKSNPVRNQGPRQASLKRNVGSHGKKKKNKSTNLADISDVKFSQRKPKKMRLLSELINTDQVGGSADAIEVDHANTVDLCESGKSKLPPEVGKDADTPVINQKVSDIQSRAIKNKEKHTGVDNEEDGSSLMNWLKKTHKKVRIEKNDSEHKNFGSSAVSSSNPDMVASNETHHDIPPSAGDLGQQNVLSTTNAKHGNENEQNDNLEQNMQRADDLSQNELENLKRGFFSNGKSTILLKRKVLSPAIAHGESTDNCTIKKSMLWTDDLPQMESEDAVQTSLTKVSLGKQKIQNVSGLNKQNVPKNKKKRKLEMHEKQNVIDDIPMDIVELLARNQHERQLMTNTNSSEKGHTRPKIGTVDCAEIVAKDNHVNTSTVLDVNFQKSLASESKQKCLQGHASSGTESANVHPQDLHMPKPSQCHTGSSTEAHNSCPPESHMQNSFQVNALPITGSFNVYPPKLRIPDILECTQEQQTHFRRDEEVTIACTSPIFSHHNHVVEVPDQSWSNKGENKLTWESFKSRNSPTSTYGFQYRNRLQEVDSAPIHMYAASSNYVIHQPVIAAVDHHMKEAVDKVPPRSVPSTQLTMEAGRLYDQSITGQSGLYSKEPMPATHLLRLMDSSTAPGFTNYQRANRHQMELQTQTLGSQYVQPDQFNASASTSYGSHLVEKDPLTLQDLSRHEFQQNLHRPLRPHPRVGVLGSFLQKDIANWSERCGTHSEYRLGVSKGTTSFDMNRRGNYETMHSGMFSAGWNGLQLGSVSSVDSPEYPLSRYGAGQPWMSGNGKTVHPLDKLVRKDICETNRNPADFTVISDKNEYMINL